MEKKLTINEFIHNLVYNEPKKAKELLKHMRKEQKKLQKTVNFFNQCLNS